ncbi:hypothetical protein THAOC_29142, partial [Thalassiosira oceanica]
MRCKKHPETVLYLIIKTIRQISRVIGRWS